MAPVDPASLYKLPIAKRPAYLPIAQSIAFFFVFNFGCLSVFLTQFIFSPLGLFPPTRALFNAIIVFTKQAFGLLLLCSIEWFAPTAIIYTADESVNLKEFAVLDPSGQIVELNLPQKMVLMANHQCYCDWMYLWCMAYFMKAHGHIFIILMKRFKWIPVLGWGMQFFRFLFLERSWISDRAYLARHLLGLAKRAEKGNEPFVLMIYPEGTLVSDSTRALSRVYSEKTGIPEMTNMLIPRSTGLLFCLRTLLPSIPDLALLDLTIGYPGLPHAGYGQDYYTLRSIFFQGIPPPRIHVHMRLHKVKDLPIGEIGTGLTKGAEATQEEKDVFDKWLLERWREKDRMMDEFYKTGSFKSLSSSGTSCELPLKTKSPLDIGAAFCWFIPVIASYLLYWMFSGRRT